MRALDAAGAIPFGGDLDDPDGLAKAAAESDGVIHLAFHTRWPLVATSREPGRQTGAPEAMAAALAGSDRPFVLASAWWG